MIQAGEALGIPRGEVAAKVIDGEAIVINLSTGLYYSMGKVGGRIWSLIERGCSTDGIAAAIASEYEVSPETAKSDVADLVADLLAERLVMPAGTGVQEAPGVESASAKTAYVKPELKKFNDMAEIFAMDPPLPGLAKDNTN